MQNTFDVAITMGAEEEETNVIEEIFVVSLAKAQRFRTKS